MAGATQNSPNLAASSGKPQVTGTQTSVLCDILTSKDPLFIHVGLLQESEKRGLTATPGEGLLQQCAET